MRRTTNIVSIWLLLVTGSWLTRPLKSHLSSPADTILRKTKADICSHRYTFQILFLISGREKQIPRGLKPARDDNNKGFLARLGRAPPKDHARRELFRNLP